MERRREVEDGPPVLDGDDQAGGEGPAVSDPVHLVEDGDGRVPRPQEIGVQGVGPTEFDGATGRHQRLGRYLATEHALSILVGAHPSEDVDLDGFEIEQFDQEVQGGAHRPILAGG